MQNALNPQRNIFYLLGGIAKQPSFLSESDVYLDKNDFVDNIHKLMFFAINNLIKVGNVEKEISVFEVDSYLSQFPRYYKVWEVNKGAEFLNDAINNVDTDKLHYYYNSVKKYSILRQYIDKGIDVRDLYHYDSEDDEELTRDATRLEKMTIDEITDHYTSKVTDIKKDWQDRNSDNESFKADDDIENLIKRLNEKPDLGHPFENGYYNSLFGGMKSSKFLLRSTSTGGGKTRMALKDFCNVAFDEKFRNGQWIKNGKSIPALFISTELNKNELQTIILSYLTGIISSTFTFGHFSYKQQDLLKHAIEVVKRSNFYFEYIEDFNASDIEVIVDSYVRKYDVQFVNFDYIQASPRLMNQLKESYGMGLREDQALVYLSKQLKKMAEKYDIFMMSSTQMNAAFMDDDKNKSRTEFAIRGGKSIADKVDYGIVTARANKADKRILKNIVSELGSEMPNYSHSIFKNRNGEKQVIIWTHFNYANLQEKVLFVTDYEYNPRDDIRELEYDIS